MAIVVILLVAFRSVRYAIIGLGRAGWNIHVKALRDRGETTLHLMAVTSTVRQSVLDDIMRNLVVDKAQMTKPECRRNDE